MSEDRLKEGEAENGDIGFARKNGGGSEGGAYPNPYSGKKDGGSGGFMGHGGQSEQPYYGGDQLGDEVVGKGENPNAATQETKPGGSEEQRGD